MLDAGSTLWLRVVGDLHLLQDILALLICRQQNGGDGLSVMSEPSTYCTMTLSLLIRVGMGRVEYV